MSGHPYLFDIGELTHARLEFVREARELPSGTERNQKRQIARSLKRLISLQGGMPMPRYFFDIQDGHQLIDPSGFDCENDAAAIDKARTLAVGVSLDKPAVNPTRHIAVRDSMGKQVSSVPVYSTPSEEHPARASEG
jgi:hypothetical protein